jgi:hypothetical protein
MTMRSLFILFGICGKCIRSGCVAQGRQQAAGSGKAKRAVGLQTGRNGQRDQAMGWGLRGVGAQGHDTRDRNAILA